MIKAEKRIWVIGGLTVILMSGIFFLLLFLKGEMPLRSNVGDELSAALKERESLIDYAIDGNAAYAFVSSSGRLDYGDLFAVFSRDGQGVWERTYQVGFPELKPWKLELADVDGDGITDILTSVCKTTYYDNTEKNRLFIFDYTDGRLVKKWTGSRIAGTWKDFIAGELLPTKGAEVIFISRTEDGSEKLGIYYWFDFGFLLLAESEEYEDISGISIAGENRLRMTCRSGRKREINLTVKDGRIMEAEH